MWNCAVTVAALFVTVSAVTREEPNKSPLYPRSINNGLPKDGGGGGAVGNPSDWTMSKANLVAEFYSHEPAPHQTQRSSVPLSSLPTVTRNVRDRSHKSIFSFFTNQDSNKAPNQVNNGNRSPHGYSKHAVGNANLMASGTNFNQHAILHERNSVQNQVPNGYAAPFKPIKFPQQNFIVPPNHPDSGYPPNFRQRGPPSSQMHPQQPFRNNGPVNNQQFPTGLRPPAQGYLPPAPPSPPRGSLQLPPPPAPPQNQHQPEYNLPKNPDPPGLTPPVQYSVPTNNTNTFVPSQQYLPLKDGNHPPPPPPQFQAGPPQIHDTYSKQSVYPVYPGQQQTERPLVYVMANATNAPPPNQEINNAFNNNPPQDSYTDYEKNPVPPPGLQQHQQQPNPSALSTESLSQVLASANTKAGEAMDKTIRFVIHKPEDEDVVKNAILEDAQNRYEDVKFVNGPTLKVQRKETVYLPPKKKTVVYILLKEPQIDTDVQVMSPQEDEPVPEVYITYQKSDGKVKTKHYSPKPIKEEDMKKYLDIEADSYYSGEESQIHPRFSKSTSVSLSTSSTTSRKFPRVSNSSSLSHPSPSKSEIGNLANHRMLSNETTPLISPPLALTASNNTSAINYKKTRSPPQIPSSRRYLRHPIQCPTAT